MHCFTFQHEVNGNHNENMETYLEQFPSKVIPSIGRVNASKIQDAHRAENIKLAEICETIDENDLEADLSKFPDASNLDPIDVPFGEQLTLMVEALNAKIWIEKCKCSLLASELAVVSKELSKAREDFDVALIMKKNAEQVDFPGHNKDLQGLNDQIKFVERLINELSKHSN